MVTINKRIKKKIDESVPSVPTGMWIKCTKCGKLIYKKELLENNFICSNCHGYFRMPVHNRIDYILDKDSFEEQFTDIADMNPIDFPNYDEKIAKMRVKTHMDEAVTVGIGKIGMIDVMIGFCDTRFLMGSMGHAVGERITMLFENATHKKMPVVLFCCSGGARMQEGIVSLMQMAKTAAAIKKHSNAGLLYISILTDPTTGGVAASFATLGDIVVAEPDALIGFAGPRVIEQTIHQKLPEGFQRSEFLLEHGLIDVIIKRENLRNFLKKLLKLHQKNVVEPYHNNMHVKLNTVLTQSDSWTRVLLSRSTNRPTTLEYISKIFDDFIELHGDHISGEDNAIIGGIATLSGISVTVVGHQKGRNTKENIFRNFGMGHPEGYRKALRLMKEAEKFSRPIITFIDTPGAACGIEAEEKGQAIAIANNLLEMSDLRVPVLSILIGEGGSGGALGLAIANEVWAMENATYSVLSPEGFASILWKDGKRAKEASAIMKMTADELLKLGIIEKIIPEKQSADRKNFDGIVSNLQNEILNFISKMTLKQQDEIINLRYNRFRIF